MTELSTLLSTKIYPLKRNIHDCVDTGATLALASGVEILFPCDCMVRNYKSGGDLWTSGTSIIKDSIDNNEIKAKFKLTLNGAVNDICTIKIEVPHPTFGDILVDSHDMVLYKNNIDTNFTVMSLLYNGIDSEATIYGFKVTITPNGNMDLKARSVLVTA